MYTRWMFFHLRPSRFSRHFSTTVLSIMPCQFELVHQRYAGIILRIFAGKRGYTLYLVLVNESCQQSLDDILYTSFTVYPSDRAYVSVVCLNCGTNRKNIYIFQNNLQWKIINYSTIQKIIFFFHNLVTNL